MAKTKEKILGRKKSIGLKKSYPQKKVSKIKLLTMVSLSCKKISMMDNLT